MIRVMIRRRVTKVEYIVALLRQLRMAAMQHPGYASGETLIGIEDRQVIAVISTWRSREDWREWEMSKQRAEITRQIEPLLVEPQLTETYEVMSTEELEFLDNPSGWFAQKEHPSLDG